ncbi:MAG TPA: galactokinase family protein [Terriglobia bacterium]
MNLEQFIDIAKSAGFFERGRDVFVARAPGRLDVMGGIADYSGSLVLQQPIAEATFAAAQPMGGKQLEVVSLGDPVRRCVIKLEPIEYAEARERFAGSPNDGWKAYVAGIFLVLMRECGVSLNGGAKVLISSNVPEAKGVASSAALEVAVMQAVRGAFGIDLPPHRMALLCQMAENLVAGAPCGVMDQMTSACGEEDSLLALLCQPADLQPPVKVSSGIRFWGLDSGERHAVSGSDYGSVRCGAFMGFRIIACDDAANGYLANISVEEFERGHRQRLPEEISGEEFLRRYGGTADRITTVEPSRVYKVRHPAAHPVYEHARVREFRELLLAPPDHAIFGRLGALMFQSHNSYRACGLGSKGTDLLVDLVRAAGPAAGLYGARITGGGCGGTVAVIGEKDSEQAIQEIVEQYRSATGYRPYVFSGSSPGASRFGVARLQL